MKTTILTFAGMLLLLVPVAADAQARRPAQPQAQQESAAAELRLVYEREVFRYSAAGRRDPFRPLTGVDEMGPRFDQLRLQGILYSTGRGESVAILAEAGGRVHRVREGDVIGNSRVIEIGQLRVVLAVETFGTIRQEMLELQRRGGGER